MYYLPNTLFPLKRLSSWIFSLEVLNLKSKDFNSMYSSSFIKIDLPFITADILTPAKI